MAKPRVVCAVGPESTGKTTLCRALAVRFGVPWLAEYAREHLAGSVDYGPETVEAIAREQQGGERELLARTAGGVVLDTDLAVIAVWMREKYAAYRAGSDAGLARRRAAPIPALPPRTCRGSTIRCGSPGMTWRGSTRRTDACSPLAACRSRWSKAAAMPEPRSPWTLRIPISAPADQPLARGRGLLPDLRAGRCRLRSWATAQAYSRIPDTRTASHAAGPEDTAALRRRRAGFEHARSAPCSQPRPTHRPIRSNSRSLSPAISQSRVRSARSARGMDVPRVEIVVAAAPLGGAPVELSKSDIDRGIDLPGPAEHGLDLGAEVVASQTTGNLRVQIGQIPAGLGGRWRRIGEQPSFYPAGQQMAGFGV